MNYEILFLVFVIGGGWTLEFIEELEHFLIYRRKELRRRDSGQPANHLP